MPFSYRTIVCHVCGLRFVTRQWTEREGYDDVLRGPWSECPRCGASPRG